MNNYDDINGDVFDGFAKTSHISLYNQGFKRGRSKAALFKPLKDLEWSLKELAHWREELRK